MPQKAPSACKKPGCRGLVRDGVCSVCGPLNRWSQRQDARPSATERGYDRNWRKLREMVLNAEPVCRACGRPAEEVDHIIPQVLGGVNEFDNLQPLCRSCHEAKSAAERRMFRRWEGERMTSIVLVCGPSGAGKTTFVRAQMHADDVVLDVDALVHALTGRPWYERPPEAWKLALDLRDLLLLRLLRPSSVRVAWVIASEPDAVQRRDLAERLHAARVIVLETPRDECVRRIATDARRSDQVRFWAEVADKWWLAYRRNPGEEVVAG